MVSLDADAATGLPGRTGRIRRTPTADAVPATNHADPMNATPLDPVRRLAPAGGRRRRRRASRSSARARRVSPSSCGVCPSCPCERVGSRGTGPDAWSGRVLRSKTPGKGARRDRLPALPNLGPAGSPGSLSLVVIGLPPPQSPRRRDFERSLATRGAWSRMPVAIPASRFRTASGPNGLRHAPPDRKEARSGAAAPAVRRRAGSAGPPDRHPHRSPPRH